MNKTIENIFQQFGLSFCKGLQALDNADKAKIEPQNTSHLDGSANIDACLKKQYPESSRWDYAVAYNGAVYFIEVHPPNEIKEVVKKLHWLKDWLSGNKNLDILKSTTYPFTLITTKPIKHNPQTQKMLRDAKNRESLSVKENCWKAFPK
jgi:hypothetical protein